MDKIEIILNIFIVKEGSIKIMLEKESLIRSTFDEEKSIEESLKTKLNELGIKGITYFAELIEGLDHNGALALKLSYIALAGDCQGDLYSLMDAKAKLKPEDRRVLDKTLAKAKACIKTKEGLKHLFPKGTSISELQDLYEELDNASYDRRNFRRKMLNDIELIETSETRRYKGNKPAKIYRF